MMPETAKNDSNLSANTARTLRRQHLVDGTYKIWVKRYRTEIAASTASLASTFFAYPLDSMKTRMQTHGFRSFLACVKNCHKNEGLAGFMRGVTAPMASITLVRTVSFSAYQKSKYFFDDQIYNATGNSPLLQANTRGAWPSFGTVGCFGAAGAISGALTVPISCPLELAKIFNQTSRLGSMAGPRSTSITPPPPPHDFKPHGESKDGTVKTLRRIYKDRGLFGLYTGFRLHLLRDTIGTSIYFVVYESSKQIMANARGNEPASPFAVLVAGGLCGLLSWACIYPIDCTKSRYQHLALTNRLPATPIPVNFFNREYYRGISVSMARSCVVNAIFFSVFEMVKKYINRVQVQEEEA